MSNKEVRQSIRDDWEHFKIYPITFYPDIDPTKYRFNCEGRVVKGEYFGDKAGLPMKVCYDKKRKMKYCNVINIYGEITRLYCDDLALKHGELKKG